MKPYVLIAALSALAVATTTTLPAAEFVRTAPASTAEKWVQNYYQQPRPEYVLSAVLDLSSDGYFDRAGQRAASIGFFSAVFAQNPKKVDFWLSHISTLPLKHQRILAAAAWQAGFESGAQVLRDMATTAPVPIRNDIAALLERGATPLLGTPVRSESDMAMNWGAFLADGDERHVLAVLAAFGSGEPSLSTSARYTLAQHAAKHDRVMQICQEQLTKQAEPVREELRAVLNAATPRSNGT